MPRGVTKRRPRTRAALLAAALEVFAEYGFHAAPIEQICERAGFTRGAFYSNFSSKEELFLALFDEHSERVVARITTLVDSISTENLTLQGLVAVLADIEPAERDWYLVTTEFTLYAIRDPQAGWALAQHDARLRAEIARCLTEHLARAGRTLTVDADELARLLIAIREGGLAQSYVEPEQLPPGQLERRFLVPLLTALTRERTSRPDPVQRLPPGRPAEPDGDGRSERPGDGPRGARPPKSRCRPE